MLKHIIHHTAVEDPSYCTRSWEPVCNHSIKARWFSWGKARESSQVKEEWTSFSDVRCHQLHDEVKLMSIAVGIVSVTLSVIWKPYSMKVYVILSHVAGWTPITLIDQPPLFQSMSFSWLMQPLSLSVLTYCVYCGCVSSLSKLFSPLSSCLKRNKPQMGTSAQGYLGACKKNKKATKKQKNCESHENFKNIPYLHEGIEVHWGWGNAWKQFVLISDTH